MISTSTSVSAGSFLDAEIGSRVLKSKQLEEMKCYQEKIANRFRPAFLTLIVVFLLLLTLIIIKLTSTNVIADGVFRIVIILSSSAALFLFARMVLLPLSSFKVNQNTHDFITRQIYTPFTTKRTSLRGQDRNAMLWIDNALNYEQVAALHERLERHLRQNERLTSFFKVACLSLFVTIAWTACAGLWSADPQRDSRWTRLADIGPAALIFLMLLWVKSRSSHVRHVDNIQENQGKLSDMISDGLAAYRKSRDQIARMEIDAN